MFIIVKSLKNILTALSYKHIYIVLYWADHFLINCMFEATSEIDRRELRTTDGWRGGCCLSSLIVWSDRPSWFITNNNMIDFHLKVLTHILNELLIARFHGEPSNLAFYGFQCCPNGSATCLNMHHQVSARIAKLFLRC